MFGDDETDSLTVAKRELLEETGYIQIPFKKAVEMVLDNTICCNSSAMEY